MTDKPESVELADAQYRLKLTRNLRDLAAELRDAISVIDSELPNPATLDVHAILYAALEAADRPLERAVGAAALEIAYLTGEIQRAASATTHDSPTATDRIYRIED